jgi:hypothetical protein
MAVLGSSAPAYQRTRKRSGSGSPITMRVADAAVDTEYAAAESMVPGADRWIGRFRIVLI